ncbi:hypothetical protein T484DRAFT_1753666 [Baffinella frigidus]|nr:hypothetical protein T484DRAFT_1753666 [Cryptophyta sp. CCMP2293]
MSDGDSGGEDLLVGSHGDYAPVAALDTYDTEQLDDTSRSKLSHSARRRAEEAMSARDMQATARVQAAGTAGGRAPKALQQVSANREGLLVVTSLCGKLKAHSDVAVKACEYLRRAYIGLRCLDGVSQAALPAACIEIASKQCKRPVVREALVRRSGVKEADFRRSLTALHLLLKIRRQISVNEAFWANLPADKREAADFGRPVFVLAVRPPPLALFPPRPPPSPANRIIRTQHTLEVQ